MMLVSIFSNYPFTTADQSKECTQLPRQNRYVLLGSTESTNWEELSLRALQASVVSPFSRDGTLHPRTLRQR